ncbi:hypothetical protein [Halovivax gelatinilyticus]|uniref:hypothetical protein n=1 Tax=Halovivax gelatinilyticus TaxID=2961597 RepID=UPI0020CA71BE|nr:hypothetical protein [Halovivax gelatinilyticus]
MTDTPDLADCPFPRCPFCETPVVAITSTGPHSHSASPCGCGLTLTDVQEMQG